MERLFHQGVVGAGDGAGKKVHKAVGIMKMTESVGGYFTVRLLVGKKKCLYVMGRLIFATEVYSVEIIDQVNALCNAQSRFCLPVEAFPQLVITICWLEKQGELDACKEAVTGDGDIMDCATMPKISAFFSAVPPSLWLSSTGALCVGKRSVLECEIQNLYYKYLSGFW